MTLSFPPPPSHALRPPHGYPRLSLIFPEAIRSTSRTQDLRAKTTRPSDELERTTRFWTDPTDPNIRLRTLECLAGSTLTLFLRRIDRRGWARWPRRPTTFPDPPHTLRHPAFDNPRTILASLIRPNSGPDDPTLIPSLGRSDRGSTPPCHLSNSSSFLSMVEVADHPSSATSILASPPAIRFLSPILSPAIIKSSRIRPSHFLLRILSFPSRSISLSPTSRPHLAPSLRFRRDRSTSPLPDHLYLF